MDNARPVPPRERAVIELIQTEEVYISEISNLVECFKVPLRSWMSKFRLTARTSVSGLPVSSLLQDSTLIDKLFSNIEDILALNMSFLKNLRTCFNSESGHYNVSKIARTVASEAPNLRIYSAYVSNFDQAQQFVTDLKRDPLAAIFIEACELNGRCHGLDFLSFLIQPVQRIPRYRLLLSEILKWSEKAVERQTSKSFRNLGLAINRASTAAGSEELVDELLREISDLKVALEVVCQIAQSVNDSVAHHEKKLRVGELCQQFTLPYSFFPVNLERFVCCEYDCMAVSNQKSKKVKVVIMSDIIMYGSEQSATRKLYKNKMSVYLSSCVCLNVDINPLRQQCAVTDCDVDDVQAVLVFSDMKIVTLVFASSANKSDFLDNLSKLQRRDGSTFSDDGSIVPSDSKTLDDNDESSQVAFGLPQFRLSNVSGQLNLFDVNVSIYFNKRRLTKLGIRLIAGMSWQTTTGTSLSSLLIPVAAKKGGMLSRWTSSADSDPTTTTTASSASDATTDSSTVESSTSPGGKRRDLPRMQSVADVENREKKRRDEAEAIIKNQRRCVVLVQSVFRSHLEANKFKKIRAAVMIIQACLRMKVSKRRAVKRMKAIAKIQSFSRLCGTEFLIADMLLDQLLKIKLDMSNGLELTRFFRARGGFMSLFSISTKYYTVPIYLDSDEDRIVWDDSSDTLDDAEAASGSGGGLCSGRIELDRIVGFYVDPADAASAVLNNGSSKQKDPPEIEMANNCFEMMNAMSEDRRLTIVTERRNRMKSSEGQVKRLFLTVETANREQRRNLVRCLSVLSLERRNSEAEVAELPFIDCRSGVTSQFLRKYWMIAKHRIIKHSDQIVAYIQSSPMPQPRQLASQKSASKLFKKQSSKILSKQRMPESESKAAKRDDKILLSDNASQSTVGMHLSVSSIQMLKVPASKIRKNPQNIQSVRLI